MDYFEYVPILIGIVLLLALIGQIILLKRGAKDPEYLKQQKIGIIFFVCVTLLSLAFGVAAFVALLLLLWTFWPPTY